ncbi:PEPxxWA-CTERM sorting domain-containing protein [Sphingomonas tabacisoli]|uniref:PEPxxWA-CTERM sorting domain-containing protein n=1 Tax=Sphingomonas tabacisoli TaxID=2249466 RepID=A0ABW4I1R5_9SPHN
MSIKLTLAAVTAFAAASALTPMSAARAGVYGVQTLASERTCGGAGPAAECPGSNRLIPFQTDGGLYRTTASSGFVETRAIPQKGSYASGSAELNGGGLYLPTLHAASYAAPNDARVNGSAAGFTSFTYNGKVDSAFGLQATLTIDDSTVSPDNGLLPNGGIAALYLAIYDEKAFIDNFIDPSTGAVNVAYGATCGDVPGLLGWAYSDLTAPGGAFSVSASTVSCGGGPITLKSAQKIVAYSNLSLFTNRGGFIDASHTLTTQLDPGLGEETIRGLQTNLTAAVPEPATWAMMVGGFAMLGAAARRRVQAPRVSA